MQGVEFSAKFCFFDLTLEWHILYPLGLEKRTVGLFIPKGETE